MTLVGQSHPLITPERLEKRALIYVRQSTLAQKEQNWGSAEAQREQAEMARAYGWPPERIEIVDEDLGKSGTTTDGRCGFERVCKEVEAETVGAVFAMNVSRLARRLLDFERLRLLCALHKVILVVDHRPADPRDPFDTVMLQIHGALAQQNNADRAKTFRDARYSKARRGEIVSALPLGWVKGTSGTYEFDPEVKPIFDRVYSLFKEIGSVRGTVRALNASGIQFPSRYKGKVRLVEPTEMRVRELFVNPAYAGVYIFGRTVLRPDPRRRPDGKPVQVPVPEEQWIRRVGALPAYTTLEAQAEFREIMRRVGFRARHRVGRGIALCQGLIRCGQCGATLTVADPQVRPGSHYYQCTFRSVTYGARVCFSFPGRDFDAAVERFVLAALKEPPEEMLREALAAARSAHHTDAAQLEAQHGRLVYLERLAHDRLMANDPRNRRVYQLYERNLEEAIEAREKFESVLSTRPKPAPIDGTEEEIEALCALAADIPSLWRDATVSNRDRKEILRCMVSHIEVQRSKQAYMARIVWLSGLETEFRILRRAGMYEFLRSLHEEGLAVPGIREALAVPDARTGQCWKLTASGIYQILKRLGLTPHPAKRPDGMLREEVRKLYGEGWTYDQIAVDLNRRGCRTLQGKRISPCIVWNTLGNDVGRRDELEHLHRAALLDAKARGLKNKQAAEEFNHRGLPRVGRRRWTAEAVRQRRASLKRKARRGGMAVGINAAPSRANDHSPSI